MSMPVTMARTVIWRRVGSIGAGVGVGNTVLVFTRPASPWPPGWVADRPVRPVLPTGSMPPIRRVLVANRGEIAVRVMRTCKERGLGTVAVYSDADRLAPHVLMADQAVAIGPAPARESYLVIDKILAACRASGADAVHPGYGFLSENEDFADACAAAGITFIGPRADAIRIMGSKTEARRAVSAAGTPVVPGDNGPGGAGFPDAASALAAAERIGFPVLIKASRRRWRQGHAPGRGRDRLRGGLRRRPARGGRGVR